MAQGVAIKLREIFFLMEIIFSTPFPVTLPLFYIGNLKKKKDEIETN